MCHYWFNAVADCGMVVQEGLLRQLLAESKAYGTLLGSGGVGDAGNATDDCWPSSFASLTKT